MTDTIIILIVVLVNAIIGVAQESKAEKSLEALQKLSDHASKVVRNGKLQVIPAKELVPGDLVILDTGDYIPADLRIVEEANLKSQESSLTGESVPVEKTSEIIEEAEIGIGDRKNMLFSSSLVTYGRGKGIVVETGMTTEVGKNCRNDKLNRKTRNTFTTKIKQIRKNIRNCSINNLCSNICSWFNTRKRANSNVYDSSFIGSCSNTRRVGSSINNCFSNWCSKNGKKECNC